MYTEQNKTYSEVSIQWLEYVSHTENSIIKHVLKGGEQRVGPYFVDGYNAATNTCYEFAGCFYHGCVKCHVEGDLNPATKVSYGELYRLFSEKVATLKSQHGVRVVVMWECEWMSLTESDPAVKSFLALYGKPECLDSRKWTHKCHEIVPQGCV